MHRERLSAAHPLLPDWLIRPALTVAGSCAVTVAALGTRYAGDHAPGRFDDLVDAVIQRSVATHPHLLRAILHIADPRTMVGLVVALVVAGLSVRRTRVAALAVVGPCASVAATEFVLKPLFDRTLNGYPVFPSGHTTAIAAVAAVLTVLVLAAAPPWQLVPRCTIVLAGLAAALAAATAMVGLGYHYATDTIAGFCVAFAVVPVTAAAIDITLDRSLVVRVRRPHGV